MKKLRLVIFILLTCNVSNKSIAQDTLEYAILEYFPNTGYNKRSINVSINGVEFYKIVLNHSATTSEKFLKNSEKGLNPLLAQISSMSKDGWSVMSFEVNSTEDFKTHFVYLSRAKQ